MNLIFKLGLTCYLHTPAVYVVIEWQPYMRSRGRWAWCVDGAIVASASVLFTCLLRKQKATQSCTIHFQYYSVILKRKTYKISSSRIYLKGRLLVAVIGCDIN